MMTFRNMALLAYFATASLAAGGVAEAKPLKVVASFSVIGDFARNVGGDHIELTTLVGPNGDAHAFEPKPADAAKVGQADVVLVNGAGLEGFLPRLIAASGTKAPVAELTKGIALLPADESFEEKEEGQHEDHDHGAFDPHAWQSVENAKIYVANIAEAFCAADAADCDDYRRNADAYRAKLDALQDEVVKNVAAIPQEKRTIITSHDAFGYFAHAYGLHFIAPEGVSTEAEASAADVAALIRQVREDRASAIFVENITNPNLIRQIAAETGLTVGGELYSDALSDADGPAATYLDMVRHNVSTIRGAILGS